MLCFATMEPLNNVDISSVDADLRLYLVNISQWLLRFTPSSIDAQQSLGVVDVEREYHSSKYGMKGRIDVTLQVSSSSCFDFLHSFFFVRSVSGIGEYRTVGTENRKISRSNQHRAQLIAYSLMLAADNDEKNPVDPSSAPPLGVLYCIFATT
ncbi:DNA replication ATP-dependent helicase-like protein [Aphelenchoides besseyi]|nr:DNA replication ATP-dependent helicase-like protein [Aphelenchoides besseyi]